MEEWEAAIGKELQCKRERQYAKDQYAVAIVRKNVNGLCPSNISQMSGPLFTKQKGKICCQTFGMSCCPVVAR